MDQHQGWWGRRVLQCVSNSSRIHTSMALACQLDKCHRWLLDLGCQHPRLFSLLKELWSTTLAITLHSIFQSHCRNLWRRICKRVHENIWRDPLESTDYHRNVARYPRWPSSSFLCRSCVVDCSNFLQCYRQFDLICKWLARVFILFQHNPLTDDRYHHSRAQILQHSSRCHLCCSNRWLGAMPLDHHRLRRSILKLHVRLRHLRNNPPISFPNPCLLFHRWHQWPASSSAITG